MKKIREQLLDEQLKTDENFKSLVRLKNNGIIDDYQFNEKVKIIKSNIIASFDEQNNNPKDKAEYPKEQPYQYVPIPNPPKKQRSFDEKFSDAFYLVIRVVFILVSVAVFCLILFVMLESILS